MEEFVGGLWDKLITRTAYHGYPKERVELKEMERIAPVFFRALGGDAALTMIDRFTPGKVPPAPVLLWLHPEPAAAAPARRKPAQKEPQQPEGGKPNEDDNNDAANDLDSLAVANDGKTTASRIRFDLDLPAEADDDLVLADGILLPEWDWRKQVLQPAHCRLQMMVARDAQPCELPVSLRNTAKRLRNQFQSLAPQRERLRAQANGSDLDMDACVRYAAETASGVPVGEPGLYIDNRNRSRDLSCLLLADLSLSTDAWVSNSARVIDVIRDSLLLFGEALAATGDRFALYGFSSVRRQNVRYHLLKDFDER